MDIGALKQARLLLVTALVSAALCLLLATARTGSGFVMLMLPCIAATFLAGIGGGSMAARGLNFGGLARLATLALTVFPFVNIPFVLFLLLKVSGALRTAGSAEAGCQYPVATLADGLSPVQAAPSLTTLNGFGFTLYGKSNEDLANGSFMTTHYVVALFIPLLPIARYRVVRLQGDRYEFLGRGKLRGVDILHILVFAALVLYAIANAGLK
jgi:hypothetical protein